MSIVLDGTNASSFSGGITKPSLPTGSVLQVVNATYSTSTVSSSSTQAATGLTATITPTSATSKILVFVSQSGLAKETTDTSVGLWLYRNATSIVNFEVKAAYTGTTAANRVGGASTTYLDSPATTSAVTYSTKFNSNSNSASVYVQINDATSTITLMEIAA